MWGIGISSTSSRDTSFCINAVVVWYGNSAFCKTKQRKICRHTYFKKTVNVPTYTSKSRSK